MKIFTLFFLGLIILLPIGVQNQADAGSPAPAPAGAFVVTYSESIPVGTYYHRLRTFSDSQVPGIPTPLPHG